MEKPVSLVLQAPQEQPEVTDDQARLALWDSRVFAARTDPPGQRVLREMSDQVAPQDCPDPQAPLDTLVPLGLLAPRVLTGVMEVREPQGTWVSLDHPDSPASAALVVCLDLKEREEQWDPLDPPALPDLKEKVEPLELPDFRDDQASQDPPEKMAPVDLRENADLPGMLAFKDQWDPPDPPDLAVLLEQVDRTELLVSVVLRATTA